MSLRRTLGLGLWASALVACGALTGLDEYSEGPLTTDGGPSTASGSSSGATSSGSTSGSSSGSTSSSSSSGSTTDGGTSSGVVDAPPDTFTCTPCGSGPCCPSNDPTKNVCRSNNQCGACSALDQACTTNIDCCGGNKCATGGFCKTKCLGKSSGCNFDGPCCNGLVCSDPDGVGARFCCEPGKKTIACL